MSPLSSKPLMVHITLHFLVTLLLFAHTQSLDPLLDSRCLDCIRNVSTSLGTDVAKRCEGYYCGQFQISYTYWAEAGKPSNNRSAGNYEKCARDRSCAEQTVKAYFNKFKRDCNNDGLIDCLDMAALHRSGPTSCSSGWFYKSRFWLAFNKTSCAVEPTKDMKSSDKPDSGSMNILRTMKNQTLSTECLDCICEAVTGCNANPSKCGNGGVCGPFAISQSYWKEGKRPGASWTSCARTRECSSVTVKNYMEKYKRDCNDDGYITCEDYAAIHRRGHRACNNKDLYRDPYWVKFSTCRANQKPENDVNMVKVNEGISELDVSSGISVETTSQPPKPSYVTQLFSAPPARHSINKPSENFIFDGRGRPDVHSKPINSIHLPQESSNSMNTVKVSDVESNIPQSSNVQQEYFHSSTTTSSHAPTIPPVVEATLAFVKDSQYPNQDQTQHQNHDYISMTMQKNSPLPSMELNPQPQPTANLPASAQVDSPDSDASAILGAVRGTAEPPLNIDIVAQPQFSKSYPPIGSLDPSEAEKLPEETDSGASRMSQFSPPQSQPNLIQPVAAETPIEMVTEQKSPPNAQNPLAERPNVQSLLVHQRSTVAQTQPDKIVEETIANVDPESLSSIYEKSINESGRIAGDCLECICDASSNCDTTVQCISKQREKNRCGLYMISYNQFVESDISLLSLKPLSTRSRDESEDEKMYRECTTDKTCAERLIHLYIEKYQRDCNNDGKIDCYDIAAIHRVGPENCNSDKFLSSQYWRDFSICYTTDRLTTTVQA